MFEKKNWIFCKKKEGGCQLCNHPLAAVYRKRGEGGKQLQWTLQPGFSKFAESERPAAAFFPLLLFHLGKWLPSPGLQCDIDQVVLGKQRKQERDPFTDLRRGI